MRRLLTIITSLFLTSVAYTQTKDFPILGGELSNSAVTSVSDIEEVLPRMKVLGLNTVLVPVYWEFLEPIEGQMDFTLIDRTIDVARQQGLKIIPLWFGAWKNSMSCYAPAWFKRDVKRFPRAVTAEGKPLEIASCFSDNVLQADLKAVAARTAVCVLSMSSVSIKRLVSHPSPSIKPRPKRLNRLRKPIICCARFST